MMATDRGALLCDLAETYGVFDMGTLPVPILATLASGLRETSRIRMKMNGVKVPFDKLMTAAILDRVSILVWQNTKDGSKGSNMPKSIVELLTEEKKESEIQGFDTADEFERAWERATGVAHGR